MHTSKTEYLREHRLRLLAMGYSHAQLIVLDELAAAERPDLGFPCRESLGRLARESGVDRSYVSKTLKKAAADGVILEYRRPGGTKYETVNRFVNVEKFGEFERRKVV